MTSDNSLKIAPPGHHCQPDRYNQDISDQDTIAARCEHTYDLSIHSGGGFDFDYYTSEQSGLPEQIGCSNQRQTLNGGGGGGVGQESG